MTYIGTTHANSGQRGHGPRGPRARFAIRSVVLMTRNRSKQGGDYLKTFGSRPTQPPQTVRRAA